MKKVFNKVPYFFKFILSHYLLGLLFLFCFRLILFYTHTSAHPTADFSETCLIKRAFSIGLQFDSVVLGYILALPLLISLIHSFFGRGVKIYKWISLFIYVLTFISFFISAADVPYFNYNFARISAVVFESASDSKIIFSMIIEEPTYAIFFLVWLVMFFLYVFIANKLIESLFIERIKASSIIVNSMLCILSIGLVFFAVRGRIDSPIRINHSFFCNNSFYNQLGLNPTFVLLKSLKQDQSIKILENDVALENVKKQLGVKIDLGMNSPLARKVSSKDSLMKKNVVLVIMESLSANKLSRFGNKESLTPFFDSLANVSLSFDNIYSAGFHTCNGIFSTLYSYPTVLRERPMSALSIKYFNSLPKVFKDNGYENRYYTSGNENFDNVGVFLRKNDIPNITSGKDYNPKFIQSSFGVPDHVLFDYVLEGLDREKKPFFSTVMTISDHGPYIIPSGASFETKQTNIKKQIVEYADWSLSQFMQKVKTKEWYKNTVFVFVADHGVVMGDITYEIPFSLHHIPLLIYSPDTTFIQPQRIKGYGAQMDVLPTVAGLLNFDYINNTYGIDLLSEKRKYGVLSSDDKFGCIDDEFYYIYRKNGKETLHRYVGLDPNDVIKDYPEKALEMKSHVISIMQSTKWMLTHDKTK